MNTRWIGRLSALMAGMVFALAGAVGCGDEEVPAEEEGEEEVVVTSYDVTIEQTRQAGQIPLLVEFTALVDGPGAVDELSYDWEFGSLGQAAGMDPVFTFDESGRHVVRVTVSDADGQVGTASTVVYADDVGVEASASVTSGFAPLEVEFECEATTDADMDVTWEFGDGQQSDQWETTYNYVHPGTYVATCVGTTPMGTRAVDSVTIDVDQDLVPNVDIGASTMSGNAPLTVEFEAMVSGGNAPFSYEWDLGDGSDVVTDAEFEHTYDEKGSYPVFLTVTDDAGTEEVAATTIEVDVTLPVASAVVRDADCVAPNTWLEVDASGSAHLGEGELSYQWSMISSPGGAQFEDREEAETYLWVSEAGEHVFRVFVEDGDGNRVASDELTVDVDDNAQVSVVAGDGQSVTVQEEFDETLVAEVFNGCGAPMRFAELEWESDNATFDPGQFYTNPDGRAKTQATAGTRAGASTAVGRVGEAAAEFDFTVEPGVPTGIYFEQPDQVFEVSDQEGVELEFRALDAFHNDVDGEGDLEFDVLLTVQQEDGSWESGAAVFEDPENGDMETTLQLDEGTASATMYNTTAGRVAVMINPHLSWVYSAAWVDLLHEEFEYYDEYDDTWSFSGPDNWEIGEPTSGPGAAVSGSNVLATVLDGDYEETGTTPSRATMDLTDAHPLGGLGSAVHETEISFSHHFEAAEDPNLDLWDQPCALALGRVRVGGAIPEPTTGYDGIPHCLSGWNDGFYGTGGYADVEINTASFGDLRFEFRTARDSANQYFYSDAGWYIDDISGRISTEYGYVDFEAAEPAGLVGWTETGEAGGAPAVVYLQLIDEFGNEVSEAGVEVEATVDPDDVMSGNPELSGIYNQIGSDFQSTDATTATGLTDEDGLVAFAVLNEEAEAFAIDANIVGVADSDVELSGEFVAIDTTVVDTINHGIPGDQAAEVRVRAQDGAGDWITVAGLEFKLSLPSDADASFEDVVAGQDFSVSPDGREAWVSSEAGGEARVTVESDEEASYPVTAEAVGYSGTESTTEVSFSETEGNACANPLATEAQYDGMMAYIHGDEYLCADDLSRVGGDHACGDTSSREDVYFEFEAPATGDYEVWSQSSPGGIELIRGQCEAAPECAATESSVQLTQGETGFVRMLHSGTGCEQVEFALVDWNGM